MKAVDIKKLNVRLSTAMIYLDTNWEGLAQHLGVTRQTITAVKSGSKNLGQETLRKLSEIEKKLGITSKEADDDLKEEPPSTKEHHRVVPVYKIGSVTTPENLQLRNVDLAWLEAEIPEAVKEIIGSANGRSRIGKIGIAIGLLKELQERCVDEWTGKKRNWDGSRD